MVPNLGGSKMIPGDSLVNAHPLPVMRVVDAEEQAEFLASVFGYRRVGAVDVGEGIHWLEMTAPSDRRSVALADMSSGLWSYGSVVFVTKDLEAACRALEFRGILFQDALTRLVPDLAYPPEDSDDSSSAEVTEAHPGAPPSPARARAVEFVDRQNEVHLLAER